MADDREAQLRSDAIYGGKIALEALDYAFGHQFTPPARPRDFDPLEYNPFTHNVLAADARVQWEGIRYDEVIKLFGTTQSRQAQDFIEKTNLGNLSIYHGYLPDGFVFTVYTGNKYTARGYPNGFESYTIPKQTFFGKLKAFFGGKALGIALFMVLSVAGLFAQQSQRSTKVEPFSGGVRVTSTHAMGTLPTSGMYHILTTRVRVWRPNGVLIIDNTTRGAANQTSIADAFVPGGDYNNLGNYTWQTDWTVFCSVARFNFASATSGIFTKGWSINCYYNPVNPHRNADSSYSFTYTRMPGGNTTCTSQWIYPTHSFNNGLSSTPVPTRILAIYFWSIAGVPWCGNGIELNRNIQCGGNYDIVTGDCTPCKS